MSLESSVSPASGVSSTGGYGAINDSQNSVVRHVTNLPPTKESGLAPGADVEDPPILATQPAPDAKVKLGPGSPPDGDDAFMKPAGQPGGSRRKKSKSSRIARKSRSTRRRKSSRRKSRTATTAPRRNRRRTTRK